MHPPSGDRGRGFTLSVDLAGLFAAVLDLAAADAPFDDAADAVARHLLDLPGVVDAFVTAAGPPRAGSREVVDPLGTRAVRVVFDDHAEAHDRARLDAVLTLVEAAAGSRTMPLQRMRAGSRRSGSVVATIDAAGRWYAAPETVAHVLGHVRTGTDLAGLRSLVHPDDLEGLQRTFRHILAHPNSQSEVDIRAKHADGHWVVLRVAMINLLDVPTVGAVVVHGHDVTAVRAAERVVAEERRRIREVVSRLTGGVVLDDGERVILANSATARMLGRAPAPNTPIADFLDLVADQCHDPASAQVLLAQLSGTGVERRGVPFQLTGGRTLVCDVLPLGCGDETVPQGVLWYLRDTTEETTARSELEEHNRALTAAAEIKSRFVAVVSHELRTPLTAIHSFGELLLDESEGMNPEHVDGLAAINRNAARLLRLVDDLLLLTRLEALQLPLHRHQVDVPELVDRVRQDQSGSAADRGVALRVEVEPGPNLHADPLRLAQVLDNLVGNAIKFTAAGGEVVIRAVPEGDGWTISVADTGIGIPEHELPRLFEAFARASNAASAGLPGSGLGLTICAQIVELHGGRLTVDSTEGEGTTVRVRLPGDGGER
ncbi:hypothetical protein GCM10022243_41380 [Saccharothrix violaceirubra]|uniref:histidine kinase n=1 Tax=Saccharothrix violaceirubra TaxID=413306 RepID=A0A7W7T887_9PSEU|nr:PAS domain-containing sensor histidine kinase [Saccharothrix violaceirubra]MBB4968394.1 signal transduction histidine kinase [Saccharothrix violaceirubra]